MSLGHSEFPKWIIIASVNTIKNGIITTNFVSKMLNALKTNNSIYKANEDYKQKKVI